MTSDIAAAKIDEETPREIDLDVNKEGYPILPTNSLELSLDTKKKLTRKYVTTVRSEF